MTEREHSVRKAVALIILASSTGAGNLATAQSAAATPSDSTSDTGLQEVVVTAERREETVQRSSLALEVVSGAALDTCRHLAGVN